MWMFSIGGQRGEARSYQWYKPTCCSSPVCCSTSMFRILAKHCSVGLPDLKLMRHKTEGKYAKRPQTITHTYWDNEERPNLTNLIHRFFQDKKAPTEDMDKDIYNKLFLPSCCIIKRYYTLLTKRNVRLQALTGNKVFSIKKKKPKCRMKQFSLSRKEIQCS